MSIKQQVTMAKFLQKYPEKWHSFASDRDTVECVYGLHNLGILKVEGDQMRLRSAEKAERWIESRS